ncbi:MAG: M14 family zinc carboxypeptidase [Thermoplasmata archaeon]
MRQVYVALLSLMMVFSMFLSGISLAETSAPPESPGPAGVPDAAAMSSDYPFTAAYPSLTELYGWYDSLVGNYSGLVSKMDIGASWQGRALWVLNITADEDTVVDYKPGVLITGNIHAREWSAHQAAAYFAWFLLENYETNDTIHWLLNNRRIYVMPMLNPDGYYYDGDGNYSARKNWRKNTRDNNGNGIFEPTLDGVDLNRNWDIDWESGDYTPGNITYHGPYPFSENETIALRGFMLNNSIDSFQDIHSYAGTLLIPWCYTGDPSPHNAWYRGTAAHMTALTSSLGVESNDYSYGQAIDTIFYNAPGGSIDWVYDALGMQGYCFELQTGGYGFYPPTSLIMTINQDVDDALLYQVRVADVDLGDGTVHLFPPVPYIVYGIIQNGKGVAGTEVTIHNWDTGEDISIFTDSRGYYELNLASMAESGYTISHAFNIAAAGHSLNFTIGTEWGRKIDLGAPLQPESLTVEHWTPDPVTETRYMRSDNVNVNALGAYSLGTARTTTYVTSNTARNSNIYCGIRVYRRNSSGAEAELSSNVSAVAGRTALGAETMSGTWVHPGFELATTDSIVVRLYADASNPPGTLRASFTTGQLGARRLESSTWAVHYYVYRGGTGVNSYVRWGSSVADTRIEGFSYVEFTDPENHNRLNWTHTGTGVSHFNVYRSETGSEPWAAIGVAPAGTNTYTDINKGMADATFWWYIVRAESSTGLEEANAIAVQEPGGGTPYSIGLAGKSNWVFVSFPVQVSGHIEALLNDTINGDGLTDWDVAKAWDNQNKRWLTYRKGSPASTFSDVDNTVGAWLHLTRNEGDENLTLAVAGSYTGAVNITLYAGWNMVGYPSATNRTASATLPPQADIISIWQAASPYVQDRTDLENVLMEHGNAYWVHVTADCIWTVPP